MAKNLIREIASQLSGEAAYRLLELTRDSDPDTAIQAARRLGLHAAGRSRRTSKRTSVKATAKAAKRAEMFAAIHRDPAHQLALLKIIRGVVASRQPALTISPAEVDNLIETASREVETIEVLPPESFKQREEQPCFCRHELQVHRARADCSIPGCRCQLYTPVEEAEEVRAQAKESLPVPFFPRHRG
jgi:hypothetical protein